MPSPILFTVSGTLGALTIGTLISCFLFGIAALQAYIYYFRFPHDALRFKLMVTFVLCMEVAHCICICHYFYITIVDLYPGGPEAILHPVRSLPLTVILSGIVAFSVQVFFAERVRVISNGKLIIPILCWSLSAVVLVLSIVTAVRAFEVLTITSFVENEQGLVTSLLCTSATLGIILAAAFCWTLSGNKHVSGEMNERIKKIITWAIETGLITSLGGFLMAISFIAMPDNFVWVALFICLPRSYSNSLFASLNSRPRQPKTSADDIESAGTQKPPLNSGGYRMHRGSVYNSVPAAASSTSVLSGHKELGEGTLT